MDPIALSKQIETVVAKSRKKNPTVAAHNQATHLKNQIAERRAHSKRSHKAMMQRKGK